MTEARVMPAHKSQMRIGIRCKASPGQQPCLKSRRFRLTDASACGFCRCATTSRPVRKAVTGLHIFHRSIISVFRPVTRTIPETRLQLRLIESKVHTCNIAEVFLSKRNDALTFCRELKATPGLLLTGYEAKGIAEHPHP